MFKKRLGKNENWIVKFFKEKTILKFLKNVMFFT